MNICATTALRQTLLQCLLTEKAEKNRITLSLLNLDLDTVYQTSFPLILQQLRFLPFRAL